MIKVEHLMKKFPNGPVVLSDISFEAEPGELIAVLGGSGSGKTTLLRCLALHEAWSKGNFVYDGKDIFASKWNGKRKIRREWAYLEEKPVLFGNKKALKNVLIGRYQQTPIWRIITGMVRNDDYMGAMDTLEKLGLIDKAHFKAEKLSGGEKQRVAIARALVHGAKVIVADEPVSGLDPHAAAAVMEDLKQLCQREQIVMICALHQVELAERFATRIWGLKDGKLALDIRARKLTQRERDLIL